MKIIFNNDEVWKYPYVVTILKTLKSKIGEVVVVENFHEVNDGLKIVIYTQNNEKIILHIINADNYNNSCRKVLINDSTSCIEEYICNLDNVTSYKENDIYHFKNFLITKSRLFSNNQEDWRIYTIEKDGIKTRISMRNNDDIIDILKNINCINLIGVYSNLKKINPELVKDIIVEMKRNLDELHETLIIKKGNIFKYEKNYIDDDNIEVSIIYLDGEVEIITRKADIYDRDNQIYSDIVKVKSLFSD